MLTAPRPGGGLYIHVPFCGALCSYCNFARTADHDAGLRGMPSIRVLVRFNGPRGEAPSAGPPVAGVSPAENALEFVVAETVVRNQGGALAVQAAEGDETILVLDLPAPP